MTKKKNQLWSDQIFIVKHFQNWREKKRLLFFQNRHKSSLQYHSVLSELLIKNNPTVYYKKNHETFPKEEKSQITEQNEMGKKTTQ